MKHNNYKPFKADEKLNFYSGAPVNKGFFKRNLNKAKKLYMDEYDRLQQQINKRRQDREFHEILSNYYNDFNKLKKKHPFLQNHGDFNKPKKPQNFDFNQYELKKKNISALFFKYDNFENDLDFDVTDELINSMNDGNNKSFLNSFEIREDYKKRLALNKRNEGKDGTDKNNNNINLFSPNKNINLSIISNKNKSRIENIKSIIDNKEQTNNFDDKNINNKNKDEEEKLVNEGKNDIIIEDYQNNQNDSKQNKEKLENKKEEKILNEIKKDQEDELTIYRNYLKKNKFPCFEDFINPYKKTEFIPPPIFIQNEPLLEKKDSESNKSSEYNDFVDFEGNKNENENESNLKKSIENNNENAQLPMAENLIDVNTNMEYQNNQFNDFYNPSNIEEDKKGEIKVEDKKRESELEDKKEESKADVKKEESKLEDKKEESKVEDKNKERKIVDKKEESKEDEYENEKFEEIMDNADNNNINLKNENIIENKEHERINQYPNGELKMMENLIKDDKYPQFEQIINPYYQTDYIPPDVFAQPEKIDIERSNANENKETNSHIETAELALRNGSDGVYKESVPNIEDDLSNNNSKNNQMLENIIENNNNYNYKIPYNNNVKEEDKNELNNNEERNGILLNQFGINNGKDIIQVNEMINQNFQQNNVLPEEIKEENDEDNEFNDFEAS